LALYMVCRRILYKVYEMLSGVSLQSRMWELIRKRQQYQQVRKPKVADCGMDKCCTEGSSEMQTMFPTPVITIDSLKERLKLSPNPRRNSLNPAASSVNLDPKTINGDVCLLTDSPFRILRVSDGNSEWCSCTLTFCTLQHLYSAGALLTYTGE
jgi:hypothetical protein